MSALMTDTLLGRVHPGVANAVANLGGKLQKMVEMQYRYGQKQTGSDRRFLSLVPIDVSPQERVS